MPIAAPIAAKPRNTIIRLGRHSATKLEVMAWPGGTVSLNVSADCLSVHLDLAHYDTAELVAALAPNVADLIDALETLANAADNLRPSRVIDDAEVTARARDLGDAIADARALLKAGA